MLQLTDGFDELCQDHKSQVEERRSAVLKELEQAVAAPSSEADRQRRIDQIVREFSIDIGIRTTVEQDGELHTCHTQSICWLCQVA